MTVATKLIIIDLQKFTIVTICKFKKLLQSRQFGIRKLILQCFHLEQEGLTGEKRSQDCEELGK